MRILIAYPGSAFSTFDVATGYEAALIQAGHTVHAFNYHDQLAFYQESLKFWEKENQNFNPHPSMFLVMASERLIIDVIDFVPDVALIISGYCLHRRAFDLIYKLGIPIVLLLTESPYQDESQAIIIEKGHVDLSFTNDKSSLETLPGLRAYLPHSYNPLVHYPIHFEVINERYKTDVFFHGTLWPERRRMFSNLTRFGDGERGSVVIGGFDPSVKDTSAAKAAQKDLVSNEELAKWYNGTKIAINHHRTFTGTDENGDEKHINGTAWSLGPRAYEISACGAFQLCDDTRPELKEIFGDTVATYKDQADLEDKIDYYLSHESEREDMAQAAFNKLLKCSFGARAKRILMPTIQSFVSSGRKT